MAQCQWKITAALGRRSCLLSHMRQSHPLKLVPPCLQTQLILANKKSPRQNSAERLCRFKYFGDFCVDVCDSTFSNTTTFKSLPQALDKAQGCTWLPSFYLTILNLSHHLQCAGVYLGLVPPTQHLQGCSHLLYSQHWMVQSALQT